MSAHAVRSGVASPESAVCVLSPLNPFSFPNSFGAATPIKSPPLPLGTQGRPRGHSTSTIHQNTSATSTLANPLSCVTSEPAVHFSPTLTVSDYDHNDSWWELEEALEMFSISILIFIMNENKRAKAQRQADTKGSLLGSRSTVQMLTSNTETSMSNAPPLSNIGIGLTGLAPSPSHKSLSAENMSSSMSTIPQSREIHCFPTPPGIANLDTAASHPSPSTLSPSQIRPTLQNLYSMQDSVDVAHDMADLRGLMRAALSTSGDAEMLHVLQIGKEEMPEALESLQRELERVNKKVAVADATAGTGGVEERERPVRRVSAKGIVVGKGGGNYSKTMVGMRGSGSCQSEGSGGSWGCDTLDQDFLKAGIEALQRMSNGIGATLPSRAFTRLRGTQLRIFLTGSPDSHADANSFRTAREESHSQSEENLNLVNYEGYDSPPPADERLKEIRNERCYRMLLDHPFHPSLTLPLWDPSPVSLGAVGYLSKPSGSFITLFDALSPENSSIPDVRSLPSVHGYGRVSTGSQHKYQRNAAQCALDAVASLLTFSSRGDGPISQNVGWQYSFPLRAGHKTAYMCAETTVYRYAENLEAPKKWFKANVDTIMRIFGAEHRIQKEDLFLVIGTLSSQHYALFVSHAHPAGQVHFNVFSSPESNRPWGTFTTDTQVSLELGGPSYDEPFLKNPLSASKVSNTGGPWNTVLLARLRFKPDALEPTLW